MVISQLFSGMLELFQLVQFSFLQMFLCTFAVRVIPIPTRLFSIALTIKVGSINYVEAIFEFKSSEKCKLKKECSELHD